MPVYNFLLSFHIIGFIVWMAGLFYWIRIMVYQSEASEKAVLTQLQVMSERLHRVIIIPGMILTWVMGLALMFITEAYLFSWFHFKTILVTLLTAYQFGGYAMMKHYRKAILHDEDLPSSKRMRIYNELATLLMVGIVFSVILREFSWIAIGYGVFTLLLIAGFGGYWLKARKI